MPAVSLAVEPKCYNRWFSKSGLPELHEVEGHFNYARRLCRYISDPTTVRARTCDAYGMSPSLAVIQRMRAEHVATIERRAEPRNEGGTEARQALVEAERARKAPAPVLKLVPVAEPKPAPEVAPSLPPVAARGFMLHTAIDVIDACADACEVSHGELIGSGRQANIVQARNLAIAVLRARGNSYPTIARFVRRDDHTTIMHGLRMFFDRDMREERFQRAWANLAPCVAKACRSAAEVNAIASRRL